MSKIWMSIGFLIMGLNGYSTNFYFSAAGNDVTGTGTMALPWKSTAKFNSVFSSKAPGDSFLFRRGDTFLGNLTITRSGSSGSPIVVGAYGSGAQPVITGLTSVTGWINIGGSVWESTLAVSTLSTLNLVTINGINTAMGRIPNTGYYLISGFGGTQPNETITSLSLNASVNDWTGAQAVIRKRPYMTNRATITSHAGNQITYNDPVSSVTVEAVNFGFFIQNDYRTLDIQNEWYYNPTSKKIRIFSSASPTGVQVATISNIISAGSFTYITFDNLNITGANNNNLTFNGANITVQNCTLSLAANNNIESTGGNNSLINNNIISDCGKSGIFYNSENTGAVITNNTIRNSGIIVGQGDNAAQANGIFSTNLSAVIKWNRIIKTGAHGVKVSGDYSLFQYNFIDSAVTTTSDQGGMYTGPSCQQCLFDHNIILHTLGEGTAIGTRPNNAIGIYADENGTGNSRFTNNTSAFGVNAGIKIHVNSGNLFRANTSYANATQQIYLQGPLVNDSLRANIFFSRNATEWCMEYVNTNNNIVGIGVSDSNYFARPINDNLTINTFQDNFCPPPATPCYRQYSLAQWRTFTAGKGVPFDVHSNKSPLTITNVNQLDFQYNATTTATAKGLPPGTWMDVYGDTYSGTITLQPYTSAVLINTGTVNAPPIASAGTNKNITLPINSVSQVGSGTDGDGSVASYLWTYISGPATYTIVSPTSATTTISNLVAGTYVFNLRVTDNLGATGNSTVQIIVNASPPANVPPTASAGGNKNITLPTSTVTQAGAGTDSDGSISTYAWTKTSGPATFTIVSPSSATTVINNLIAGTYVFTLTVTDNLGATGTATASVTVNGAANVNPSANAGINQVITWPTNSATLSGSGTDTDGSIVSYSWTKVSGTGGTITTPSAASTTVTGLSVGVYVYRLTVADNSGATATDDIQITVNKGSATISLSNLAQVYTGAALSPTVTTSPAGLSYSLTLGGVTGGKTNVGSYAAFAGITDPNWNFTPASNTFTITKASAVINATNKTVNYDGNPQTITATTTPSVTGVSATYTGISGTVYPTSASPPTAIGTYRVDFTLTNANYQATAINVTLTIVSNAASIFISDTLKTYDGFTSPVVVTTNPAGLPVSVTYNLSGTAPIDAGTYNVIATITSGGTGADTATLVIAKRTAVLSWAPITAIPEGSQLTATQLNAVSDIAGTWSYSSPLGTVLPVGGTGMTATFTPTDMANNIGGTVNNAVLVFGLTPFLKYFIGSGFYFIDL